EEVFQVDAGFAEKSRVVVEEQREAERLAVFGTGEHDLRVGARTEQGLAKTFLGGDDLMLQSLVFAKCTDEIQNRGHVGLEGTADGDVAAHGRGAIIRYSADPAQCRRCLPAAPRTDRGPGARCRASVAAGRPA